MKYKFVDPLSAGNGTHQPKHFGFETMLVNQMNNRDYAFEIYRENIRDDFVFDGDEQTIWQTERSIPNTKDYLFMPLFKDVGLKRAQMNGKEASDYLKFANFADHAFMDDLDDRISLNFALNAYSTNIRRNLLFGHIPIKIRALCQLGRAPFYAKKSSNILTLYQIAV